VEQQIFDLNEWVSHMIKMTELEETMARTFRLLEVKGIDWK
jgi:hypothetical protein